MISQAKNQKILNKVLSFLISEKFNNNLQDRKIICKRIKFRKKLKNFKNKKFKNGKKTINQKGKIISTFSELNNKIKLAH